MVPMTIRRRLPLRLWTIGRKGPLGGLATWPRCWHFTLLTLLEGSIRPAAAGAFVERAVERCPDEPRFVLSHLRQLFPGHVLGALGRHDEANGQLPTLDSSNLGNRKSGVGESGSSECSITAIVPIRENMVSRAAVIVFSVLTGICLELGIHALSGRREAWDSAEYWTVGLPIAAASIVIGFLSRRSDWIWTVLIIPSQVMTMMVRGGEIGGLWPLTLILSSILSAPFLIGAFIGSRFRRA
ncbi:MAG TPA: hypothetical protein VLD67_17930 [Vicinamibacterales bacterium]|nr:hypothetical protein [Vicinamibacterales bacterium]